METIASLNKDSISINCNGRLTVSFRRTIRVPDNESIWSLPPDFGPFPLYSVSKYRDRLPEAMVAKGGAFLPMYRKWPLHSVVQNLLN